LAKLEKDQEKLKQIENDNKRKGVQSRSVTNRRPKIVAPEIIITKPKDGHPIFKTDMRALYKPRDNISPPIDRGSG